MRKRILITGVDGFIGRAIWRYIKKRQPNFSVSGLDVKNNQVDKNIFTCNLNHQRKLKSILTFINPDCIFHFAGGRMANAKELLESNFLTTKYLLDTIGKIQNYHPRIIIPGSAAEYGKVSLRKKLIKESYEPKPISWYGLVKLMQTNLGLAYARAGFDIVVVRMFNIMGAGTPSTLALGSFAQQIAMIEKGIRKRVIHTKNLNAKRDFLDIDDVCQALLLIAQSGKSGQIYNICSGYGIRIRELLEKLLSYAKVKDIIVKENKNNSLPSFEVIGSNAKLRAATKWFSKMSIEKSLKNTLQGYRSII